MGSLHLRANILTSSSASRRAQKREFFFNKGFILVLTSNRVVLTLRNDNIDARPTLFRTYDKSSSLRDCTIWEVARATSAAPTFFKPIKLGREGTEYIDAGFGYNNPCDKLIAEARNAFPGRSDLQILSIGTGHRGVVSMNDTRVSIIKALQKMATSSNEVAASLDAEYGDSGQYFRFNVEHGLENIASSDWDQDGIIAAHTNNYLSRNSRAIERFVKTFTTRGEQSKPDSLQFMKVLTTSPPLKS